MKRVLIVDDHAIYREGLKQVLKRAAGSEVLDEAADAREALLHLRENEYDLVVLDVSLPDRSGLDILPQMRRSWPAIPVLMLSMHPEEHLALRALRAGAAGYVAKGGPPGELVDALQRIAAGKRYVSPALADFLAESAIGDDARPLHETLSTREYQVMCLIATGVKPGQIAEELLMSVKTVGTYRVRILQKMRMRSNAEITRYALENGLI